MMSERYELQNASSKRLEWTVSAVGLAAFCYALYRALSGSIAIEWVLLSIVTVFFISRIDIRLPKSASAITLSDTFVFTSILLYGLPLSVLLAGVEAAVNSITHKDSRKFTLFNASLMSLSIFISGKAMVLALGEFNPATARFGAVLAACALLALFHFLINSGLVGLMISLRNQRDFFVIWKESVLWTSFSTFVGAAAACLIYQLIAVVSFLAFIIAVPILAITYFTYKVYLEKVEVSNRHAEEMAALHLRTIEALAIAIDAKDEVTHDHVRRVQIYCTGLARLFGLSDPEIEALKAGALLHDIGKLAVPDYILNKPGTLTPAEFEKMKVHTIVGAEILERVGFPYPVVPVVRHHHERWDGRGYPDGLRGDEIPITARILAVADCYDAVREERQYRRAMTRQEAIDILRQGSNTTFDPNVIAAFLDHLGDFENEIREQGLQLQTFASKDEHGFTRQRKNEERPVVYERIRSAHKEVITLYDIAQTIGKSLDLRDTFAVFSSRLHDIVGYTTCVLYLTRHDTGEIEAAHVSGRNAELIKGKKMSSGIGIAGWVVANSHPMHNSDPRLDFDALRADIKEAYRTATVVPMIKDDEAIGALALYSTDIHSYHMDHLRLVEAVAKLSADAIANALHHRRTETNALTDSMTGLPNARALRYRFDEALDRAQRHKDNFCVVMMDLDGFKNVNDKLGHQAGDSVLTEIARLLVSQTRSTDFVSRYAGDEFVAILHVTPEEAKETVNRIQSTVEKYRFVANSEGIYVGVSAGFSCYKVDGTTLDELILAADRDMYSNKLKRKEKAAQSTLLNAQESNPFRVM
ncbi:MAG: diguanylate cyclase [Acidobacteria bacterium]|nr:diguanylate cyclase [Acidobacteriota bacterium]